MEYHALFSFRNNLKELPGHVFCEKKNQESINNLLSNVRSRKKSLFPSAANLGNI